MQDDTLFQAGAAVVIGGSGGIGRATCRALAAAGADVALTWRSNAEAGRAAAAEVEAEGRRAEASALDVTDRAAVAAFLERAAQSFGGIHTLVLATGADISMTYVAEIEDDEWDRTVAGDLTGCYNVIKAAVPHLRASRGSVVAMTSAALHRYAQKDVLSAVPKAAVEVLIKGVAREEGRAGVRANAIALGVIDAGLFHRLTERVDDRFLDAMKRNTALRRFGQAEEAADLAVFLASRKAGYITGQSIALDGGYSI
ncbi:SDR family oxidoreductase [uncultured Albimonas sp.]|uniref:SDR family NAD(P)-dependent oxidoreductase n=1 Tax=uncultured Albimonas sp. TaxID=1331701 RepID=UPI0030EEE676|tara:strand:+ start:3157 stop:3924 length:768 start_codon:yes stop_codon:yes gene_type:complete